MKWSMVSSICVWLAIIQFVGFAAAGAPSDVVLNFVLLPFFFIGVTCICGAIEKASPPPKETKHDA